MKAKKKNPRVELYDAKNGRVVWRGTLDQFIGDGTVFTPDEVRHLRLLESEPRIKGAYLNGDNLMVLRRANPNGDAVAFAIAGVDERVVVIEGLAVRVDNPASPLLERHLREVHAELTRIQKEPPTVLSIIDYAEAQGYVEVTDRDELRDAVERDLDALGLPYYGQRAHNPGTHPRAVKNALYAVRRGERWYKLTQAKAQAILDGKPGPSDDFLVALPTIYAKEWKHRAQRLWGIPLWDSNIGPKSCAEILRIMRKQLDNERPSSGKTAYQDLIQDLCGKTANPRRNPCGRGEIDISRRRYRRKGYRRQDGTYVKPTVVPAASFCIPDPGTKGRRARGAKKGPYRKDPAWIEQTGSLGGPGYTKKKAATRRRLLDKCVRTEDYRSCLGKLQVLLRSTELKASTRKTLEADKKWLVKKYGGPGSFEKNPHSDELVQKWVETKQGVGVDELYMARKYARARAKHHSRPQAIYEDRNQTMFYVLDAKANAPDAAQVKFLEVVDASRSNPYQGDAIELAKYRKQREEWERKGRKGPPPVRPGTKEMRRAARNPKKASGIGRAEYELLDILEAAAADDPGGGRSYYPGEPEYPAAKRLIRARYARTLPHGPDDDTDQLTIEITDAGLSALDRFIQRQGNPMNPKKRKKEERVVFSGYEIQKSTSTPTRRSVDLATPGDYGADPIEGGLFRMVPSGDIVDFDERTRRLRDRELRVAKSRNPTRRRRGGQFFPEERALLIGLLEWEFAEGDDPMPITVAQHGEATTLDGMHFVEYDEDTELVVLTDEGRRKAEALARKHANPRGRRLANRLANP